MSEFVKRAERILVDEGCLSPDETCRNQPGTEHYCHTCILDEALAAKDATIEELRALLEEVTDPEDGGLDEHWVTTGDGIDFIIRCQKALRREKAALADKEGNDG